MADSIPRAYLKEITDTLAAETLKVALFTNLTGYDPLTASTYAVLAGTATEVSNAGTGYTTGGIALTTKVSSNLATNGAKFTADNFSLSGATFTCRYAVLYNSSNGKIRLIKDLGSDYPVSSGTFTLTWDATNGILKTSF